MANRWLFTGIGAGVGIALVGVTASITYVNWISISHWYRYSRHAANIEIKLDANGIGCIDPKTYPLRVDIQNNSSRTVQRSTWYLRATRTGYSDNFVRQGFRSSDKVLKPGERFGYCMSWPDFLYAAKDERDYEIIRALEWTASGASFDFAD